MLPIDRSHLYDGQEVALECVGETVWIPGPAGPLEGLTACPERESQGVVAVILHPHPLYGGSLQNKVVHYLSRICNRLGIPSLRFNFRGVGRSCGHYDQGRGEVADCLAVMDWVEQRRPGFPIWLAGFSFGAYVAYQAAQDPRVGRLLTVAPPVNLFDFSRVPMPTCPWTIVQGREDELVPAEVVRGWVIEQGVAARYLELTADHFFHGALNRLQDALLAELAPQLPAALGKPCADFAAP